MIGAAYSTGAILWFVIAFVIPLWALVSAATTPSATFRAAHSSKVLWVIMPILLGFLAAMVYFFYIRPRLRRASPYR